MPVTETPEASMSGRAKLASGHSTAGRILGPMTPVWARLPVSAAPRETESVRDVVFGSCRVFRGNLEYLVGTARCGPACRGGVGPGADLLGQSPGTRLAVH